MGGKRAGLIRVAGGLLLLALGIGLLILYFVQSAASEACTGPSPCAGPPPGVITAYAGLISAVAGLITAITGLIVVIRSNREAPKGTGSHRRST